jgi:uncharacterized metal-binding protein YceD (DUF177 family)
MTDDFAHHFRLDRIRDAERLDLWANEAERNAAAKRLGLPAIDRLEAHVMLARDGERVRATGRVVAALEQSCIVTGDPIPAHVDEPFDLVFLPEPATGAAEEIELGHADCDIVFYEGAAIDLGGAIADTLALSLDPYPRSAAADVALREAGVVSEAEAGPFAALAQLKKGLERS